MSEITATEYLYGIDSSVHDDSRFYQAPHVVTFRITKKTPKRIYYERRQAARRSTGYVDRQKIESEGEVYNRASGWWSPDFHLYLNPPVLEQYAPTPPNLDELKAAMRAAHPDMGGTHEAFLEAHERYEQARVNASRTEGNR